MTYTQGTIAQMYGETPGTFSKRNCDCGKTTKKIVENKVYTYFKLLNSVYHPPLRFSKVKSFQERVRVSDHKPSKQPA